MVSTSCTRLDTGQIQRGIAGSKDEPLSMLVARAFHYMKAQRGAREALRFLSDANEYRRGDDLDDMEDAAASSARAPELRHFEAAFQRIWRSSAGRQSPSLSDSRKEWEHVLSASVGEEDTLQAIEHLGNKGIPFTPALIFNGKVSSASKRYSLPEQALMQMDQEAMQIYELLREGRLRDGGDVQQALLKKEGVPKYNARILTQTRAHDAKYGK